jgi:6-phosphogluconate dehydrogenase
MYDQSKHSELIHFQSAAIDDRLPPPVIGFALGHCDELMKKRSPAKLIQGLRDEFGVRGNQPFDKDGKCHADYCQTGIH